MKSKALQRVTDEDVSRSLCILAREIRLYYIGINIDIAVKALVQISALFGGKAPRFQAMGGTMREHLTLQNIQARLRMVIGFSFSRLLPWFRSRDGFLLVLAIGSADSMTRPLPPVAVWTPFKDDHHVLHGDPVFCRTKLDAPQRGFRFLSRALFDALCGVRAEYFRSSAESSGSSRFEPNTSV